MLKGGVQDGKRLKDFYRFAAQNPHIELHDACQIVITRPKASVCFSFEEWNAMGRRVTRGRKGIAYYDREGNKHFVFDANDTHGDRRYNRLVLPMKRMLVGLDVLNGTEIYESSGKDYDKILSGVANYLSQNEGYTEDEERNRLLADGITYSLYSKTGFPKEIGIELKGLPYSLRENARLFKEITDTVHALREEVEQAYFRKINEVVFIDDTEENAVSDEPVIVKAEQDQVNEQPQNPVTPYYQRYLDVQEKHPNAVALMRLGDFYEVMGENAVAVASELDLTLTGRNVGLSERVPMCVFPYHVTEQYIEKILERHSVVVIEDGNEPKYILSHAAAHEQSESADEQSAAASDEYEPDFTEEYLDEEQADEYEDYYDELADEEDDEERAESQPQEKQ